MTQQPSHKSPATLNIPNIRNIHLNRHTPWATRATTPPHHRPVGAMLRSWWQRWPERLEYELEMLRTAGVPFDIDQAARAAGTIKLNLRPTVNGEQLNLVAVFPDLYPYVRFEIFADDLDLHHHQNPLGKNLCLIGRSTSNWNVSDTIADFIKNRIPLVLSAARTQDAYVAESIEEHQGEPVSNYYSYEPERHGNGGSSWSIPITCTQGELVIGLQDQVGPVLRGVVLEVRDHGGKVLAAADSALFVLYPKIIRGRWFRAKKPAQEADPRSFLEVHAREYKKILQPLWRPLINNLRADVVGVLFPEEVSYREMGDGWIFVVRIEDSKAGKGARDGIYFARGGRAGRTDLSSRVPELKSLTQRRVVVIGLGGIGAPSAIEFARSGMGELRILDRDVIEPGTVVRWPLGIAAAGVGKHAAIKEFLSRHYPYTKVAAYQHTIGSAMNICGEDFKIIDALLDGADLVYDATAELGLQYLFSDLAAERDVPYICVSTTPGAWGGLIARIRPGQAESGCWMCLQQHLTDSSIPTPASDPKGMVQPRGCADPTFTGAGCDVAQVALAGVRLAVATLCHGINSGYPDFEWDVGVLALRDADGRAIAPRWHTCTLLRHPKCTCQRDQ